MSAPSASGRWMAGDANVLSTTSSGRSARAPWWASSRSATASMSMTLRCGFDGVSSQTSRVVASSPSRRTPAGSAGEVPPAGRDPAWPRDPLEVAPGAAVDVVAGEDRLAGSDELGDRGRRSRPAREGDPVTAALQQHDRPLEAFAGRVLAPGVLVAAGRPADALLGVGARLVDRRRDRAGQLVGLLAGVNRQGLEARLVHRGIIGHPAGRRRRSTGRWVVGEVLEQVELGDDADGPATANRQQRRGSAGQLAERLGEEASAATVGSGRSMTSPTVRSTAVGSRKARSSRPFSRDRRRRSTRGRRPRPPRTPASG